MSNAYSDATHLRNMQIQQDKQYINTLCSRLPDKDAQKQLVIQLQGYGTADMIINTIRLWNKCNSWEDYKNMYLDHQYGITICPYAIKHIFI